MSTPSAHADATPKSRVEAGARPLVVLVRPAPGDATVAEAIIRIHGELIQGGFDVEMVDGWESADPRVTIETAGQGLGPAVTIGFFGKSSDALELWIADRLTGKLVVRKLGVNGEQGSRASEVLAVRAAELLRASLMELLVVRPRESGSPAEERAAGDTGAAPGNPRSAAANGGSATKPPGASSAASQPLAAPTPSIARWAAKGLVTTAPSSRWGLELGTAVIGSFEGLGPALLPLLRTQIKLGHHLRLRGTAAGLGTRPIVKASSGAASVSQALLLLEAVYRPMSSSTFEPQLSLGGGALRFGVEGDASWPYRPIASTRWSAALDAGAGFIAALHSNIEASLEAHAVFAQPYPAIQLFEDIAARAGRPTWLLSLTVSGWL